MSIKISYVDSNHLEVKFKLPTSNFSYKSFLSIFYFDLAVSYEVPLTNFILFDKIVECMSSYAYVRRNGGSPPPPPNNLYRGPE